MAVVPMGCLVVVFVAIVCCAIITLPASIQAQSSSPTSDVTFFNEKKKTATGNSIDQGIACMLMVVALLLTYLIHAADFYFSF
ncbi:hypothetical protein CXB51_008114 [Gossypium anomalum]|uniref:Arabinogalactan peptide 22 n=1 Tax=Gossypium anomalum TaxID=47600 RepID=A0A8J6D5U7_9ROSI|nr:hypothetical protein CXB51_008114 [Gossypium anomalum]